MWTSHARRGRHWALGSPSVWLLVEDDADLAALLVELLASRGQRVIAAGTVRDARALLVAQAIDVLVTDFSLPDGDGLTLIRHLRANAATAGIPAVLTSGHRDRARLDREAAALAAAFVAKPSDVDGLLAAVRRARGLLPPTVRNAA